MINRHNFNDFLKPYLEFSNSIFLKNKSLCSLNNNIITKNWTKLGSITGNNKSDTTVLLSDYAQNYSLIVLYGIFDNQIMDALVLNPTIARAKNFLNYNEGDFICRAGISVVDNTVFASIQWLTFTAVDVYGIK